jgi:hypothetical protein
MNYRSGLEVEGRNSVGCAPGIDVEKIAAMDPVVALALIQSPNKQPQVYTLRAQFITGAIDEQTSASTGDDNGFCSDFLILSARYQVRRANAFAGSIFKAQSDVANALNSGIDATIKIEGQCPNFFFNDEPIPLEMLFDAPGVPDSSTGFPYGFVAPKCGRIKAEMTNRIPFAFDSGPVEVFMSFRGISLGCGLQTIDLPFATEELQRLGISSRRVVYGDVG